MVTSKTDARQDKTGREKMQHLFNRSGAFTTKHMKRMIIMKLTRVEREAIKRLTLTRKKNLLEVLDQLGDEYNITIIDYNVCLYRDLKNGIDFEIEGAQFKRNKFDVYVWENKSNMLEQVRSIDDVEQLKGTLTSLIDKYEGARNISD